MTRHLTVTCDICGAPAPEWRFKLERASADGLYDPGYWVCQDLCEKHAEAVIDALGLKKNKVGLLREHARGVMRRAKDKA